MEFVKLESGAIIGMDFETHSFKELVDGKLVDPVSSATAIELFDATPLTEEELRTYNLKP